MNAPLPRVHLLDACGLEPPEPLTLVLDALDMLGAGEQLCLLIEREPFPLYRILSNNNYAYCTTALPDGRHQVTIWRGGAGAA